MNNPKINEIIDRLYERNNINLNEGFIKDRKSLKDFSGRFQKFLDKKKFYYDEIGVDNGKLFVEVSGDWKHEHLYFKSLAKEFFEKEGHEIAMGEVVTHEGGSDTYTANHYIAISESVEVSVDNTEVEDNEPAYNAFIEMLKDYVDERIISVMNHMVKKFSNTELDDIPMVKTDISAGFDFLIGSKLIVFVLNDGLSTEETNKGIVAILTLPKGKIHIVDTEILEDDRFYKNTILYNLHELKDMSKEMWVGDIVLNDNNSEDWRTA